MNKKIFLLLWLVQTMLGFMVALSFTVLAIAGYDVRQYISTLVIGIIFMFMGIMGIVKWLKNK